MQVSEEKKSLTTEVLLKIEKLARAISTIDGVPFSVTDEEKAQGLTEGMITGDPSRVIEILAAKIGTNDFEEGGILRSLIEGGDLSAWGLLNAVTAQSHTAKSYDRAVELEAAGGMLLDLPATEWRTMLQAA